MKTASKHSLKACRRKAWRDRLTPMDIVLVVLLGLFALLIIAPFYTSFMISLTTQGEYYRKRFIIWP